MTAWILAFLIQSAQAQTIINIEDYPTQYRVSAGYMNGAITPAVTAATTAYPTNSHKLSRGFSASHSGIDIDGNAGDPILAWQNGVVEVVSSSGPYGNKVIIRHDDTTTSVYAHLQSIVVAPGQSVRSGVEIGTLGASGNSTGSHLHFEIRTNDTPIDALPFIQ